MQPHDKQPRLSNPHFKHLKRVDRRGNRLVRALLAYVIYTSLANASWADPCGMVPPIYQGEGQPIVRVGHQMTYVFHKNDIETLVIRPGFRGKVDEFGMLIPFPTPPAIRKVSDNIFPHIANAIDPPEVIVHVHEGGVFARSGGAMRFNAVPMADAESMMVKDEVRVLSEEAVGMYEVAVLAAGSSAALSRWMDEHGYRYPNGMDKVCDEYIADEWCFVAVKTKVGVKSGADPQPGQVATNTKLPKTSSFDGHVQAMGFRFRTDELVVPMRLSTFNEGDLRNIVYLLTDEPKRIQRIPEEYVVRQLNGKKLYDNVSKLLPIRIVGGGPRDVFRCTPWVVQSLPQRRDPHPKNGIAKELFASDLLAVDRDQLALEPEEKEKQLLKINERLGLRGAEIDKLLAEEVADEKRRIVRRSLRGLREMTLTVVDGDFPRNVLANENLKFEDFQMASTLNRRQKYDANLKGPTKKLEGKVFDSLGSVGGNAGEPSKPARRARRSMLGMAGLVAGLAMLLRRIRSRRLPLQIATVTILLTIVVTHASIAEEPTLTVGEMIERLSEPEHAEEMSQQLAAAATTYQKAVLSALLDAVRSSEDTAKQGWAIVAISGISTLEGDEALLSISNDTTQSNLVRTWAAAARVALCKSTDAVMEKSSLIDYFPAIARPIAMRIAADLADGKEPPVAALIELSVRTPKLANGLYPAILAQGVEPLVDVLTANESQEVRRQAAGLLGTLANQGQADKVAESVIEAYRFQLTANEVPWEGGPLFVPGIQWSKDHAQRLVGNLIRWHVWLNHRDDPESRQQITNNLFSLQLAKAAGYDVNRRRGNQDTAYWLRTWTDVVGKKQVDALLAEQGLSDRDFKELNKTR